MQSFMHNCINGSSCTWVVRAKSCFSLYSLYSKNRSNPLILLYNLKNEYSA